MNALCSVQCCGFTQCTAIVLCSVLSCGFTQCTMNTLCSVLSCGFTQCTMNTFCSVLCCRFTQCTTIVTDLFYCAVPDVTGRSYCSVTYTSMAVLIVLLLTPQ